MLILKEDIFFRLPEVFRHLVENECYLVSFQRIFSHKVVSWNTLIFELEVTVVKFAL